MAPLVFCVLKDNHTEGVTSLQNHLSGSRWNFYMLFLHCSHITAGGQRLRTSSLVLPVADDLLCTSTTANTYSCHLLCLQTIVHTKNVLCYSPDELLIAIDGQWWIHMEVYELPCR